MDPVTPQVRPGDRLTGQARAGLSGLTKVLAGFREFISRGNAVELAVGVVVGAAFGGVITALQNSLISPLVGWVFGQPNLTDLWDIGPYSWQRSTPEHPIAPIKVGAILNTVVQFLVTAAAIYFLIVLPLNALAKRRAKGEDPAPEAPAEDVLLLREIRDLLAAEPSPARGASTETAGTGTGTGTVTGTGTDHGTAAPE